MEPKQILQTLTEARRYVQEKQYAPAINLFMQVLEEQDTIQLREELIDILQKVNNSRGSAEHCVIIGYRLLSKDDRAGALKSFARALKFNMQEYEALEKLTEICMDYPEVPKKLQFNLDDFLTEIFKFHFQHDQYLTVSQAYGSIADLLAKKSSVHQVIANVFEKESLPGVNESKRLEILARIYTIQKKIKKSKKIYEKMLALDENASRKSGIVKSVEFLKEQQRKERKKWFIFFKIFVVLVVLIGASGAYYSYHQRALATFLTLQKEIQEKESQQALPSLETFKTIQQNANLPLYAQTLNQLLDFRHYETFVQRYDQEVVKAFPWTQAQSKAQAEILQYQQKPEALKNTYRAYIQWFQKEVDRQIKTNLQRVQEKKFQEAIESLKTLHHDIHNIPEPSIALLKKDIEIQLTRLQKEYESYQKFQAQLEEERLAKTQEVQKILQQAQELLDQQQYAVAFQQHYLPLLQNLQYRDVSLVQTLSVPCFFKVPPLPLQIFQNEQLLPESSYTFVPEGILLQILGKDLLQEQMLTFKSPGFADIAIPCSLTSFPTGEELVFKRQTLYQWKVMEPFSPPICHEEDLVFSTRDGKFCRLDLSKPLSESPLFLEKKMTTRDAWSGTPQILQNRVLLSTRKENAYFLDWKTDKIKKYESKDGFPFGGTLLGSTSFLLVEQSGKLLEFQLQDDKLSIRSKATLSNPPETAPLYDESTQTIYLGVNSGTLYALKNQNGFPVRWKLKIGAEIQNPLTQGDSFLFLRTATQILAVGIQDQQTQAQIKWTFPASGEKNLLSKPFSPITWSADELFFADGMGILYCLDAKNGTLKWKTEKGLGSGKVAPLVFEQTVWWGGNEPLLNGYQRSTGTRLWSYPLQSSLLGFTRLSVTPKTSFSKDLVLVSVTHPIFYLFELHEK